MNCPLRRRLLYRYLSSSVLFFCKREVFGLLGSMTGNILLIYQSQRDKGRRGGYSFRAEILLA